MHVAFTFGLCALLWMTPVLAGPVTSTATAVTTVRAGDDCSWSAWMEDDEGGEVMVASSCEADPETGPAFRVLCGGDINIRYYGLADDAGQPASSTLVLTSGGQSLDADVVYEEMDGAFAAYLKKGSPVISLLRAGDEVSVTVKGLDRPARMVSLKGSTGAIDTIIAACR